MLPGPYIGLSHKQAKDALAKFGLNHLVSKKKYSPLRQLLVHFKNPLVLILLIAAALSVGFGEMRSATLIFIIILLSTLLNFYQEQKSNHAAEKLSEKLSLTARVIRDGAKIELKTELIVPGDIIFLSAGDIVPADGWLHEADDLFLNEAMLTGESYPLEKSPGEPKTSPEHMLYAGTNVISGLGYMEVTTTGRSTAFGKLAEATEAPQIQNAFEKGINAFGFFIIKTTVFVVLLVFVIIVSKPLLATGTLHRRELIESLLFALAITVGLTPELLPMIMSLNMAKGSLRMAKKGVIVKRLNAIPDFGSIDILCTDKTGTLTENTITLVKYLDTNGVQSDNVLQIAYINSALQTGLKNPLDSAILNFRHLSLESYRKVDEIPYDFERKRLSIIAHKGGDYELVTKGQPEEILKITSYYLDEGIHKKIDDAFREKFQALYQSLSKDGFKTLAVATKKLSDKKRTYTKEDESDLILVGLVGFLDPPKHSAGKTIQELKHYGVDVKIITGDNEWVTKKICLELRIPIRGIMIGDTVDRLDQAALARQAEQVTIFARFNPEQKRKVITALRSRGHVVGYLGDGINDAPSLKAADIGISVSNAVDVAKETADIILSNKSLHELTEGIIEGRKTFGNTLKYLMMGLSSNFGNMFSLIGAALFLPFLPILPFQVLLNNMLYDLSQTTIPSDHVDAEYIERPKKWDLGFMRRFMVVFGLVSSIFDLTTFYVLYHYFNLPARSFQTGWFIESLATQTLVIYLIRTRRSFFTSRPSWYLIFTTLSVVATGFILPFTFFGDYFSFVVLPRPVIFAIIGLVLTYLVVVELVKYMFYRDIDKPKDIVRA
jgi:Mg2+-importing ATPase